MFRRLASAMGRAELGADPRFAEQKARSRNEALIDRIVAEGIIFCDPRFESST